MKTQSICFLALLFATVFSYPAFAQDKNTIGSTVKDVTVFFQGAELSHTASAKLQKGENEIYIEGLSPVIEKNSLKIKASGGVIVTAYEFSEDYLSENKSAVVSVDHLRDSIDFYEKKLEQLNVDINVTSNLINLLQKGTDKNVSGSEKGLDMSELIKMMDYYKAKSKELQDIQNENLTKKKNANDAIARLRTQIGKESLKNAKTSGVLKLKLSSPALTNCDFTISYYTRSAGWTPYHEINIASTDQPIKISTKSKVYQVTGLDWEKVKLTFSTLTPSNGKAAPVPGTWFLKYSFYGYNNSTTTSADQLLKGRVAGLEVVQGTGDPTVGAAMRLRGGSSLSGDNSPLVVVDGIAGIDMNTIPAEDIISVDMLKDASAASIYGSRGANGVILVTTTNNKGNGSPKIKDQTIYDYVVQTETELNQVYAIDLPYTIPGNGKEQSIDLSVKETQADYSYYCVPRMDRGMYLLAEVSDWEKLELLSGKAIITYDGTYIGETFINAQSGNKKLSLTLGVDKRISVKRERVQDYSSTKLIGTDVKQDFVYKITIRNNQNKNIKMVLKEQYPISTAKIMTVEFAAKNTTNWTENNKETGIITWEEELKPGEIKEYQISYSVKYPQGIQPNF